jgi:hypothetical protein
MRPWSPNTKSSAAPELITSSNSPPMTASTPLCDATGEVHTSSEFGHDSLQTRTWALMVSEPPPPLYLLSAWKPHCSGVFENWSR